IAVAKQRVRDAVIAVKTPHKMQRLKEAAIAQLPYHPQYLRAGTLYAAELAASVSFGEIIAAEPALPGDEPPPQGVLTSHRCTPSRPNRTIASSSTTKAARARRIRRPGSSRRPLR